MQSSVDDFDVHLLLKYKIFSKQNFALQCPETTTCVVAKPLGIFKGVPYERIDPFYNLYFMFA